MSQHRSSWWPGISFCDSGRDADHYYEHIHRYRAIIIILVIAMVGYAQVWSIRVHQHPMSIQQDRQIGTIPLPAELTGAELL